LRAEAGACYGPGLPDELGVVMAVQEVSLPDTMQSRRIPLPLLVGPFAIAVAATTVADWIWPSLITDHPLALVALSSKNRFLLLTAPQLSFAAFFIVGFLRLIVTDPLTYLLGRQYGEGALDWIERKSGTTSPGDSIVRKAERLFGRAAPLVILIAPSAIWCLLAGAARMRVWLFVTCNVVGTVGRLLLFWMAADAFREPLENVLESLENIQGPLLAVTIALGVLHTIRSRRRSRAATPAVAATAESDTGPV
jgi:membrane protein DedA with SNARE-associated domain